MACFFVFFVFLRDTNSHFTHRQKQQQQSCCPAGRAGANQNAGSLHSHVIIYKMLSLLQSLVFLSRIRQVETGTDITDIRRQTFHLMSSNEFISCLHSCSGCSFRARPWVGCVVHTALFLIGRSLYTHLYWLVNIGHAHWTSSKPNQRTPFWGSFNPSMCNPTERCSDWTGLSWEPRPRPFYVSARWRRSDTPTVLCCVLPSSPEWLSLAPEWRTILSLSLSEL